jgi:hypothetical protein
LLAGEPAQQKALHQGAQGRHRERGDNGGEPEIQVEAELTGEEGGAHISAAHKHGAVRQIGNPHQPED